MRTLHNQVTAGYLSRTVLHLLVDTSTWLDLSKRRDGQRWIVAPRVLAHQGHVELLVPAARGQ